MRKILLCVFLAIALLLNTAIALAAELSSFPYEKELYGSWVEDGKRMLGVFPISDSSDAVKELWKEMMADKSNVVIRTIYRYDTKNGNSISDVYYDFYLVPPDVNYYVSTSSGSKDVSIRFSRNVKNFFVYVPKGDFSKSVTSAFGETSAIQLLYSSVNGRYIEKRRVLYNGYFENHEPKSGKLSDYITIRITETTMEFISDLEPEPDIVPLPIFPKVESDYVSYDTTVWNGFALNFLVGLHGISRVGIIIFGMILSCVVVIRLINKYVLSRFSVGR